MPFETSLQPQERFFEIPAGNVGNRDCEASRDTEKQNHGAKVSAGDGQAGKPTAQKVILQVKDQHVDQINAVTDFPEELQYRPVHQHLPAGGSRQ